MALSDALLELATRWRELALLHLPRVGSDAERLLRMAAIANDDRAVELLIGDLVRQLPNDHPIVRALEEPRLRSTIETDIESVSWSGRAMPAAQVPTSELSFIASAMLSEVVRPPAAPSRAAARSNTLGRLVVHPPTDEQAFLLAVGETAERLTPSMRLDANITGVIALPPVATFLYLPPDLRTSATARHLARAPGLLVPAFQVTPRRESGQHRYVTERPIVDYVNTILDAQSDPWGAASWWTAPNGWLGGVPLELLGSDREEEIAAAALSLQSDSW
jgi:hypothetical protein